MFVNIHTIFNPYSWPWEARENKSEIENLNIFINNKVTKIVCKKWILKDICKNCLI